MAIRVGLPHPTPGVVQPIIAVLFALVGKPGDLVITPDPDAAHLRLPRLPADAPVTDLHQIGQVLTFPPAESQTAPAAAVEAVGKSYLQDCFLRTIRNLHDPQRERMEI